MVMMNVETLHEFTVRHSVGGPPVVEPDSRQQLFPDGAICSDMGMAEPPEDADQLLRHKHRYWSLMLAHEERQFYSFRSLVIDQANYAAGGTVPLPGHAVEQLKAGKARVEKLRKRVAKLAAKVAELPENVVLRQREQSRQEQAQRANTLRVELQSITLDGEPADYDDDYEDDDQE